MSASREKKQRQSAGPDQRALRVQQEQAARRKKTVVYSVVGAVIAVLVIALLVWRTGFFQARSTAATIGSEKLTAAQLGYYYNNLRNTYAQYGLIDTSKADDEQIFSAETGETFRDHFMESALNQAQQYYALEAEALSAGHTKSEIQDDLATAIANAKSAATSSGLSYAAYLRAMYGSYMSAGVFERELTRILLASLASSEKYDGLYDSYTQAELEDYYKENADTLDTIVYSYLYFSVPSVSTTDEDGNELDEDEVTKLEDEAKAETKEKAEAALEAVKGGSTFQSQIDKYELSSGSDHAQVVGTGSISSSYSEQLLELGKDECGLVELDSGACYVISFHDRYLETEPTRDVRHIAIQAENTTDDDGNAVAPTEEAWAAAKEKMDAIEAEWNAGEKTEEAFVALAEKYNTEEVGGDLLERIASTNTSLIPELLAWTFENHQTGDTEVIQHSAADSDTNKFWSYHLVFYVGENEPVWMGTARDALASAAQTEWTDSLTANYPTTELSGANYYGK